VGSDGFVVIHAPREVKMLAGKGLMYNDLKGVYLADAGDKGVLNNFEQAWSILKPVYSKTRFIANPDSYLMDGDKTHIANRRPDLA